MRPGPELDHHLALVLGWMPELTDGGLRYKPPRFWAHLEPPSVAPRFSQTDAIAIQLLTLLELAGIDTIVDYPFPPATSFACVVHADPARGRSFTARDASLPGAVALAVWFARDDIGATLNARAATTGLIATIPNPTTAAGSPAASSTTLAQL